MSCGNLSVEKIRGVLESRLGTWAAASTGDWKYTPPEYQDRERPRIAVVNKEGAAQTVIRVAAPGIARRQIRDTMRGSYKLVLSGREAPCPTLAALNGPALGAGLCVAR